MTDETAGERKPEREELKAGAQLGKYKLERVLGQGGMGVVWAARDPDLEREVALKVLRGVDAGQTLRTRLLREARAMARLKHPNVLTVYEVGSDGDRDYIAMELVDGANLDVWLRGKPPLDEIWRAILASGRGLAAAHAAELVHRDFKPHNVLRSREGRVLVTDFGLARGTGDETGTRAGEPITVGAKPGIVALADTVDATPDHKSDGLLDSTLTQPGMLIGTPAYMAPEQYLGAPCDARTDQFAFCITAWQALAGERPFRGESLDELRRAAVAGVAGVRAELPRGVRAVLARGLDASPDARWPSLDALLDALEAAERAPRRRRSMALAGLGAIGAAALAIKMFAGGHAPPPPPPPANSLACDAPETAFAEAWAPARRAMLVERLGPPAAPIADAIDEVRATWIKAYAAACKAPPGPVAYARLGCLLGERDELAGMTRLLDTIPAKGFQGMDAWGLLPRVEACEGESPVAPPALPDDRKLRDRIAALRARLAMLRLGAPEQIGYQRLSLLAAARAIGWKPLEAEVEESVGMGAQIAGQYADARTSLGDAAEIAEQVHDYKLEATARIALLEVEMHETAQPGERGRYERLVEQARAAVHRAGDDPLLAQSIELITAMVDVEQGRLDRAIDTLERGRQKLLEMHALRQAMLAAANEIDALVRRARNDDLDTAWHIGLATEAAVIASHRAPVRDPLSPAMVDLAWRRGSLDEAHLRADRLRHPLAPADAVELKGRVVGADGSPAAGARVVAWRGELEGDATRAYIIAAFEGDLATTDASGNFTLHAPAHGAIIAELGAARATPVAIDAKQPLVLHLAPTRRTSGAVIAHAPGGIEVAARFAIGADTTWLDLTAADSHDGKLELAGIPPGTAELVARRDGRTVRAGAPGEHAVISWPTGALLLDVVSPAGVDTRNVYLFRGTHDPKSVAELEALARTSTDVVVVPAGPIGFASQHEVGFANNGLGINYATGERHAVFREVAPGDVTVCGDQGDAVRCWHAKVSESGERLVILGVAKR